MLRDESDRRFQILHFYSNPPYSGSPFFEILVSTGRLRLMTRICGHRVKWPPSPTRRYSILFYSSIPMKQDGIASTPNGAAVQTDHRAGSLAKGRRRRPSRIRDPPTKHEALLPSQRRHLLHPGRLPHEEEG